MNAMKVKRLAVILPSGDKFVCRITRGGYFVSSTVHATRAKAEKYAAAKNAKVVG